MRLRQAFFVDHGSRLQCLGRSWCLLSVFGICCRAGVGLFVTMYMQREEELRAHM
jgi:hypothetical protein